MSEDYAPPRRRVELIVVPLVATLCMVFIIGAIVLNKNNGSCTMKGWDNQVAVTLGGNPNLVAAASAVTACVGSGCIAADPPLAKSSLDSSELLMHQSNGTWIYSNGTNTPVIVSFKVFDSSGQVLSERAYSLNWTRVGGSEQCGGPMAPLAVPLQLD